MAEAAGDDRCMKLNDSRDAEMAAARSWVQPDMGFYFIVAYLLRSVLSSTPGSQVSKPTNTALLSGPLTSSWTDEKCPVLLYKKL